MFLTILATLAAFVMVFGGPMIWALYSSLFGAVMGTVRGGAAVASLILYVMLIVGQFIFTAWVIYVAFTGWVSFFTH